MKKLMAVLASAACLFAANTASAFKMETHTAITKDALRYMGSSYANAEQKRAYDLYVSAAGGFDNAAKILGDAAAKVDMFQDTHLVGWWIEGSTDVGFGVISYTSIWHFIDMKRGTDQHGNDHGGYDYRYLAGNSPNFINYNELLKAWLYNRELYVDDYNTTEAHYRQGSYSTRKMYADYQTIPWQPVDNLGNYWYEQFKLRPSLPTIGYVTHAGGDVAVAQHTWSTSSHYHPEYEAWVKDNYTKENLNDFNAVAAVISSYDPRSDLRAILTQTAQEAYLHPEVLTTSSSTARLNVAKAMVPRAIATNVTLLTKAINHLYGQGGL